MEPSELTGQTLEGYRLDRIIGQGGMGSVFEATHLKLGRKVAIKVLSGELAGSKEYVSRFLHEARVVNDVRHPNIVDITDFFELEAPRRIAYVMELLKGPSLKQLVRQRPLDPTQTANVMIQIVSALEAVHGIDVVHRDLKPDNILVVGDPTSDLSAVPSVKVLDFGIAKVSQAEGHKTATGLLMGTPAYMAPEQIAAEPVTAASDVYALGEIIYECLTGKKLYDGQPVMILKQKLKSEVPAIDLPVDPGVKTLLEPLIRRTLLTDGGHRPDLNEIALVMTDVLRLYSSAAIRVTAASVPATYDRASSTPSGAGSWPSPSHPAGSMAHPPLDASAPSAGSAAPPSAAGFGPAPGPTPALLQAPEGGASTETSAGRSLLSQARPSQSRVPALVAGVLALAVVLGGAAWLFQPRSPSVVQVVVPTPADPPPAPDDETLPDARSDGAESRDGPAEPEGSKPAAAADAPAQAEAPDPDPAPEPEPSRSIRARRRRPQRKPPEPSAPIRPEPSKPLPAETVAPIVAPPTKPSAQPSPAKKKLIKKDEIKGW